MRISDWSSDVCSSDLERALKVGDELGGHIVTGHVDGVGRIAAVAPEGDSQRVEIEAGAELAPFLAPKGSIAVDGVSLTVNTVDDLPGGGVRFGPNDIPHTAQVNSLATLVPGTETPLETDSKRRGVQSGQKAT